MLSQNSLDDEVTLAVLHRLPHLEGLRSNSFFSTQCIRPYSTGQYNCASDVHLHQFGAGYQGVTNDIAVNILTKVRLSPDTNKGDSVQGLGLIPIKVIVCKA